ncbi:solute carrier family 35 member F1-like [Maniola hyperantus]|uniref:solute carrier family 35 member F1-like n=1 Tax=Aphantopus hyperantus TaxID=2795564 RepID=UPI003749523E
MENVNFSEKIEDYFSELGRCGVGAALVGGAWRGQRLGVAHVAGATLGLMAVVCVVWADVEGAPTDGKNQLVGDMLCLGGSLLYAVVTVLQEIMLKTHSCAEYLALLGFIGSILSCTQTFFLDFEELMTFNWYEIDTIAQLGSYCGVQTVFQILQSFMLREAGSIILHLSFLSADYYTLIAGMYIFQFKFHALYFLSYLLAMVGVFLFSARSTAPPAPPVLPQLINDSVQSQDNVSMEYTVPTLDCIPLSEGLEPPMSRDTTFTSFLGGPQTNMPSLPNGTVSFGHPSSITSDNEKDSVQD